MIRSPAQAQLDLGSPVTCMRERLVFGNEYARVSADDVFFHNEDRAGVYVHAGRPGNLPGVVILPLAGLDAGLVQVYRYPVRMWEWGFPRGMAHGPDPEATARQELAEEIGGPPQWLEPLGRMTPDSGFLSSIVHVFAAGYDERIAAPSDTGEVSAVTWVPLPELNLHIAAGDITDGFTLAALSLAHARGIPRGEFP